jgi:hypothetical protein
MMVGIVVGTIVAVAVLIGAIIFLPKRQQRQREHTLEMLTPRLPDGEDPYDASESPRRTFAMIWLASPAVACYYEAGNREKRIFF